MQAELTKEELEEVVAAYRKFGSKKKAAEQLGMSRSTFRFRYSRAIERGHEDFAPVLDGRVAVFDRESRKLPTKGKVTRYIITSAQNNTKVHEVWHSLKALAKYYDAEIMVSRYTYNKNAYSNRAAKPGTTPEAVTSELWFDPVIANHLVDNSVTLAPGLVFCGEHNISPTAVRPLSGLESYTGRASSIIPHAKVAMASIASGKNEPTKFNYTTGTVTLRNYIQKKAGLKAEFHHVYSGLLVEVDHNGNWYVRQLIADKDGVLFDLDVRVKNRKVTTGHRVEAITWGDIHAQRMSASVFALGFENGTGMLDDLKPRFQFMHDVFDHRARNHHERGNPHAMFQRYVDEEDSVFNELVNTKVFLEEAERDWCETVVVDSNHDNALTRWLAEADYRRDPVNAEFFLTAQLEKYRAIRRQDKSFHLLEWALRDCGLGKRVRFLREDESFILCRERGGGIEAGMHGHLGPNGSRGGANGFARMGRKSNVGHSHTTGIWDGVYTSGTSSDLDMEYNKGPSSWSHSHTVTYPNGKRAILTMWAGKWRA